MLNKPYIVVALAGYLTTYRGVGAFFLVVRLFRYSWMPWIVYLELLKNNYVVDTGPKGPSDGT